MKSIERVCVAAVLFFAGCADEIADEAPACDDCDPSNIVAELRTADSELFVFREFADGAMSVSGALRGNRDAHVHGADFVSFYQTLANQPAPLELRQAQERLHSALQANGIEVTSSNDKGVAVPRPDEDSFGVFAGNNCFLLPEISECFTGNNDYTGTTGSVYNIIGRAHALNGSIRVAVRDRVNGDWRGRDAADVPPGWTGYVQYVRNSLSTMNTVVREAGGDTYHFASSGLRN